jgi:hypothetical protein
LFFRAQTVFQLPVFDASEKESGSQDSASGIEAKRRRQKRVVSGRAKVVGAAASKPGSLENRATRVQNQDENGKRLLP